MARNVKTTVKDDGSRYLTQLTAEEAAEWKRMRALRLELAARVEKAKHLVCSPIPAAACPRCGGWTGYGGMSQYSKSTVAVLGRTGCTC